jgi:peptidoglycan/LPS O-acetylase OafA/YrhL
VTFYAFLPLYALVLARPVFHGSLRRVLVSELTALFLLSLGSFVFRYTMYGSHPNLGFTLAGTIDWFALGMGLAVVSAVLAETRARPRVIVLIERRPSICWLASLAIVSLAAYDWHRTRVNEPYSAGVLHLLWGLLALLLLLPAAFAGERLGMPRRFLSLRVVAWLGLVSYGIYLWHLPLLDEVARLLDSVGIDGRTGPGTPLLALGVAVAASGCAAVSYYLVERPFLRLKEGRTKPPHRPADAGRGTEAPERVAAASQGASGLRAD